MADGPTNQGGDATAEETGPSTDGSDAARDVVVPLSLYKIITVFSTLIAGGSVVGGFMILDVATQRASAPPEEIDPLLSLLGLGFIAAGGAIYAFSGRFRAPGMGTTKTEDDEGSTDG